MFENISVFVRQKLTHSKYLFAASIVTIIAVFALIVSLVEITGESEPLVLTDSEGDFLLHPAPELMFSRELNSEKKWQTVYKTAAANNSRLHFASFLESGQLQAYYFLKKIILSDNADFLNARVLAPINQIDQAMTERRTNVYTFLIVVSCLLLSVLIFFNYSLRKNRQLADTRAYSQAIIGGSTDAIISLNKDGMVSSWNPAAQTLFGMTSQQVIGKPFAELSLLPALTMQGIQEALNNDTEPTSFEATIMGPGKVTCHLLVSISLIAEYGQKVSGVALTIRDITTERLAEDKIRHINLELEQKVATYTAELEKVSETKSAFISNISHQMRTQLDGIIGNLYLLKRAPLSEQQNRYLETTVGSVQSLSERISDILELHKATDGLQQEVLPDIAIFDQQARYCEGREHTSDKVIVLSSRSEPKVPVKHFSSTAMFKPVLLSDFLNRAAGERHDQTPEQDVRRRETDLNASDQGSLEGATVLVVDDNDINVEVAAGVLSALSLNCERASNGQQAIEKLLEFRRSGRPIHCLLMDCQMPVLNGYEATRKIRNDAAGEYAKKMPIIAMTVSAMMGERNKCLDAGMDDYVTKPISAEKLATVVTKWILSVYTAPEKAKAPSPLATKQVAEPDLATMQSWDKKAALARLMNNNDLLVKICHLYVDSTPEKIARLREAINSKNFEGVRTLSHALKGASGDIGATRLYQQLGLMERQAQLQNIEEIEDHFKAIESSYTALMNSLHQELLSA